MCTTVTREVVASPDVQFLECLSVGMNVAHLWPSFGPAYPRVHPAADPAPVRGHGSAGHRCDRIAGWPEPAGLSHRTQTKLRSRDSSGSSERSGAMSVSTGHRQRGTRTNWCCDASVSRRIQSGPRAIACLHVAPSILGDRAADLCRASSTRELQHFSSNHAGLLSLELDDFSWCIDISPDDIAAA